MQSLANKTNSDYYFANGSAGLDIATTGIVPNPIIALNPDIWLDITDLSTMKQETTGAAATTAAVVDSPVGSWLSKGSQAVYFVSPNDGARPTLKFSGTKGYYLEFTSGKNMSTTITSLGNPISGVSGVESTATDGSGFCIFVEFGTTLATAVSFPYSQSTNTGIYAGAALTLGSHSNNTPYVVAAVANGGSSKIRRNGGSYTTGNAGSTSAATPLAINKNFQGNSNWGHNNYGFAIWSGVKSDADLLIAEQVFAQQMGVTLS